MAGIDSYTKLLLHCNRPNGTTSNTLTFGDGTKLVTAQSILGTSSCYFDGTDDYIALSGIPQNVGTGDITIEGRFRFETLPSSGSVATFISNNNGAPAGGLLVGLYNNSGNYQLLFQVANNFLTSNNLTLSINTWYHFAICRESGIVYFFQDGIAKGSGSLSDSINRSATSYIGSRQETASLYFNGWMEEFRVSTNARWISGFTVPTVIYISDIYTVLLCHFEGINNSTISNDSAGGDESWENNIITYHDNAEISTVESEFGGASASFDGSSDYITVPDSSNYDFGTDDFTVDFWVRLHSLRNYDFLWTTAQANLTGWIIRTNADGSITLNGGHGGGGWDINITSAASVITAGAWTHIALVRNGTGTNGLKLYVNGTMVIQTTYSTADSDAGNLFQIGAWTLYGYYFYGYIDEFRVSKGIARWTSNFTPPIEEYAIESNLYLTPTEDLSLNDSWELQTNPDNQDINDTLSLADSWELLTNPEQLSIDDSIFLNDTWELLTNPEQEIFNETVNLSDNWIVDRNGLFSALFNTFLSTAYNGTKQFLTNLTVGRVQFYKYATNLSLQVLNKFTFSTDLRVQLDTFQTVTIGSLDDYIVKLDGTSLNASDIDFQSINITFNLNSTPSSAQFTLSRRHDDLDHKLDGSYSQITNENKIEIYDGTTKLFTGYITQLFADSTRDVATITVEDIRYKLALNSMELKYGGAWLMDSNSNGIPDVDDTDHIAINDPSYIRFEKNINTALKEVFTAASGLISGYDSLPFAGTFVPEYVKSYNTYASLIDELLQNTANANWYTDENERLRFQVVGNGQIKTLQLSSLTEQRHPYDTIVNDIRLNKKLSNYAKSLKVKLGTHIVRKWYRRDFSHWLKGFNDFYKSRNLQETESIDFQRYPGEGGVLYYVGINQTIYGDYVNGDWVLIPYITVQWQDYFSTINSVGGNGPQIKTSEITELGYITVGSGQPQKEIYLTSYGIKEGNEKWEELSRKFEYEYPNHTVVEGQPAEAWLAITKEEQYNQIGFVTDLANFELNQNNKLLTTATITILLDAYKYYNIKFSDMINITNTISSNIYNNNNGFPLNIDSINFNLARRSVTLNLTNYGKTAYAKSTSILTGHTHPTIIYYMKKYNVLQLPGSNYPSP